MKRLQPTRRSIAEVALLVAGILLAFWIDAWWERRQQREVEASLVEAVQREIGDNRENLDRILATLDRGRDLHDRFMRASPEELMNLHHDSVGPQLLAMSAPFTFDPSFAAASALLQTPPLDSEVNLEVRMLLGRWMRGIEDSREEGAIANELGRSVMRRVIEHAVEHNGPYLPAVDFFGAVGPSGLAQLRTDEGFVAASLDFWTWQSVYSDEIRAAGQVLDSLATVLEER